MTDLLLETTHRRDYRLKIVWGCKECGWPVHILLDRTPEETEENKRNIKQICYNRHITIPFKQCTVCKTLYSLDDFICGFCEPEIKEITRLELILEEESKHRTEINLEKIQAEIYTLLNNRRARKANLC